MDGQDAARARHRACGTRGLARARVLEYGVLEYTHGADGTAPGVRHARLSLPYRFAGRSSVYLPTRLRRPSSPRWYRGVLESSGVLEYSQAVPSEYAHPLSAHEWPTSTTLPNCAISAALAAPAARSSATSAGE